MSLNSDACLIYENLLSEKLSLEKESESLLIQTARCNIFLDCESSDRIRIDTFISRLRNSQAAFSAEDVVHSRSKYIIDNSELFIKNLKYGLNILKELQISRKISESLRDEIAVECHSILNQFSNNLDSDTSSGFLLPEFTGINQKIIKDKVANAISVLDCNLSDSFLDLNEESITRPDEDNQYLTSNEKIFIGSNISGISTGIEEFEIFLCEIMERCTKSALDSIEKKFVDISSSGYCFFIISIYLIFYALHFFYFLL
jgi:hypothetical protein